MRAFIRFLYANLHTARHLWAPSEPAQSQRGGLVLLVPQTVLALGGSGGIKSWKTIAVSARPPRTRKMLTKIISL